MAKQQHGGGRMPRSRLEVAADAASWCLALWALAAVLVVCATGGATGEEGGTVRGASLSARWRPCEEIYVVAEGETLHGISDRCGDPYILERNPHVHDPDDVFPGLVLRITTSISMPRQIN